LQQPAERTWPAADRNVAAEIRPPYFLGEPWQKRVVPLCSFLQNSSPHWTLVPASHTVDLVAGNCETSASHGPHRLGAAASLDTRRLLKYRS
jgi:hypothetical protein